MKKTIIAAIILFTSCQVPDNKSARLPVVKSTEVKETAGAGKICLPQHKKQGLEVNKKVVKTPDARVAKSNAPSLTKRAIDEPVNNKEKVEATHNKIDPSNDEGGGGNYEEGYIPFIKQYW